MKTYDLDYRIEAPDNFDAIKFNDAIIEAAEQQNALVGGLLVPYNPKSRFARVLELLKEIIWTIRFGDM